MRAHVRAQTQHTKATHWHVANNELTLRKRTYTNGTTTWITHAVGSARIAYYLIKYLPRIPSPPSSRTHTAHLQRIRPGHAHGILSHGPPHCVKYMLMLNLHGTTNSMTMAGKRKWHPATVKGQWCQETVRKKAMCSNQDWHYGKRAPFAYMHKRSRIQIFCLRWKFTVHPNNLFNINSYTGTLIRIIHILKYFKHCWLIAE